MHDNRAYRTPLRKWEYGALIEEGKRALAGQDADAWLSSEQFSIIRVSNEPLAVRRFELTTRRTPDTIIMPVEGSVSVGLDSDLQTVAYDARYARQYNHPILSFKAFAVPDRLYVVFDHMLNVLQPEPEQRQLIQWAEYTHNFATKETLDRADHAFLVGGARGHQLVALVSGLDALVLGEAFISTTGRYRPLE